MGHLPVLTNRVLPGGPSADFQGSLYTVCRARSILWNQIQIGIFLCQWQMELCHRYGSLTQFEVFDGWQCVKLIWRLERQKSMDKLFFFVDYIVINKIYITNCFFSLANKYFISIILFESFVKMSIFLCKHVKTTLKISFFF